MAVFFCTSMIIHEHTILSELILEKQFICDLNACKGACCVEGDYGAPITEDDKLTLEELLPEIKPYLSKESLEVIEKNGISELDKEGDLVTTCLPSGECVFTTRDAEGVLGCSIEQAYHDGKVRYKKPLSCHLYPIRVSKVGDYDALNYHKWEICKPACALGELHKVPVYKFLKEPLVRAYGVEWYNELTQIAKDFTNLS